MLLASIYLVVAPITTDPKGSLIALGVVLAGLPFYWLFIGSDHAPKCIVNSAGETTLFVCQKCQISFVKFLQWGSFITTNCTSMQHTWRAQTKRLGVH